MVIALAGITAADGIGYIFQKICLKEIDMSSLFHKERFLAVVLVLVMVSMACSLSAPATEAAPPQLPKTIPTDTSQPPVVAATQAVEQPTTAPEPTQEITATPPGLPGADFGGVTFLYDPQVAGSVSGQEVPAVNEGQGAPWEIQPATITFNFDGYPVTDSQQTPQILVFPVTDFEKMSESAATEIAHLRVAIADHPQTFPDQGLPFLPTWNAAQVFHSKVSYFSFSSGQGVRYLTMYAQNFATINNKVLFYTYQGLTSDGKYYVSAIFPVTNAILPPDESIPGGDFDKFSQNIKTYLAAMQDKLDAQPDEAFVPSLTVLDDMIKSIAIKK
jgi:hypothetical protein